MEGKKGLIVSAGASSDIPHDTVATVVHAQTYTHTYTHICTCTNTHTLHYQIMDGSIHLCELIVH